ncbi:hypothetical protein [Streptomyces sp. NPDC001480]|uniref:hypothetical protein n=1 Tax=Streptomyces sp. NPDC001480 TaxID=3364577 RepID=UPI0036A0A318
MRGRYPIVEHRELRPWWRWSAWRERRRPLVAGRGQVLVHVVDEMYGSGTADPARCTAMTLVNVRPGRLVSAHWELTAAGSDWDFPVTATFRCTVVDPVAVARSRRTGAPWDVKYVLWQYNRPWQLNREHPVGDEDGLRLALTTRLQARPVHREIAGVRVELEEVSVGSARFVSVADA